MQKTSLSYDEIIAYFGKETIEDRYKYLYDKMQGYIDATKQSDVLYVNQSLLHQAVMDYFADIYRLKMFHKIKHVNITKIVAYEIFWILRRKPIQLKEAGDVVFANEGFLTVFVTHELLVPEETEPLSQEQEKVFLNFLSHFYYYLKYRNVDKQSVETMLLSFETAKSMYCE